MVIVIISEFVAKLHGLMSDPRLLREVGDLTLAMFSNQKIHKLE